MRIFQEEIFGPVLTVTAFDNGRQKKHKLAVKHNESSSDLAATKHKMAKSAEINQFLVKSTNFTNGFHRLLKGTQHLTAAKTDNEGQALQALTRQCDGGLNCHWSRFSLFACGTLPTELWYTYLSALAVFARQMRGGIKDAC